nr:DUF490 domain-containing protein [Paracoccaceae bacterium]
MSALRAYLAAAVLALMLALSTAALSQDTTSKADRGFLQGLIEDNLSGIGREVRLVGFAGALSSRATIDELTVADAEGVWLSIRGAAIQWNRSALLRGRIEIAELSAGEIVVARTPVASPEPGLPDPAAKPFRLPDLPVSVEIGTISADAVTLGAPLLGEEVAVSLGGSLRLSGGEGA